LLLSPVAALYATLLAIGLCTIFFVNNIYQQYSKKSSVTNAADLSDCFALHHFFLRGEIKSMSALHFLQKRYFAPSGLKRTPTRVGWEHAGQIT
jgi:hypothetical protein